MAKRQIPMERFAVHKKRAEGIRKYLIAGIKKIPSQKVAVAMSAGVDSHALLFAALEAGKTPVLYSFTLDDRKSRDFSCAKRTARILDLEFVPVILPTDIKVLKKYVTTEIYGPANDGYIVNKASVECLWPFFRLLDRVKEPAVLLGLFGDSWYCTSRSQKKLWVTGDYNKVVEAYLKLATGKAINTQVLMMQGHIKAAKLQTRLFTPYGDPKLFAVMKGMDPIHEGCYPIQKAPVRLAFWDYFEKCKESVYTHVSLQKGDSGIEEHFRKLLKTDLNQKNYKSTVGLYNEQLRKWQTAN